MKTRHKISFFDWIDQHNPATFPINFETFTFNAFAVFLKTFKKNITMRHAHDPDDDTIIVTSTVTIVGSFSNACSALSRLFTECNVEKGATIAPKHLWKQNALYLKGAQRTGAREM